MTGSEIGELLMAANGDGLEAVAAVELYRAGMAPDGPAVRRPTSADLADWLAERLAAETDADADDPEDAAGAAQELAAMDEAQRRLNAVFTDEPPVTGCILSGEPHSLAAVHAAWKRARTDGRRVRHPLSPIVKEWMGLRDEPIGADDCEPVPTNRRFDSRILPKVELGESTLDELSESEGGALYGGIDFGPDAPDCRRERQLALPSIPTADADLLTVPLLDLVDWRGRPVKADSAAAPWALRLHIGAQMLVPEKRRPKKTGGLVVLAPTLGDIRRVVAGDEWRTRRHWEKLRRAMRTAEGYWMQAADELGRVFEWRPLVFVKGYRDYAEDAKVRMIVQLPKGCGPGPKIDMRAFHSPTLRTASRFRAFIAASCLTWIPGRTQRPLRDENGKKTGAYGWAKEPDRYPVLSRRDRHRLAFGIGARRETDIRVDGAWTGLPGFTVVDEDAVDAQRGVRGWRLMPNDALPKSADGSGAAGDAGEHVNEEVDDA